MPGIVVKRPLAAVLAFEALGDTLLDRLRGSLWEPAGRRRAPTIAQVDTITIGIAGSKLLLFKPLMRSLSLGMLLSCPIRLTSPFPAIYCSFLSWHLTPCTSLFQNFVHVTKNYADMPREELLPTPRDFRLVSML